jgi:hypothetical protein
MRRDATFSLILLAASGCLEGAEPAPPADLASDTSALESSNALTTNALVSNALTSNALISNALISNALISNALISNALISNALISNALISNALTPYGMTEGEMARLALRYMYSCAMPAGSSMELVIGGVSYGTYEGQIGLAPQWGIEGGSCDQSCQRWVSACMLARTNYYGVPVRISLRGNHPALQVSEAEAAEFSLREGSFFGNVFGEEVMVAEPDYLGYAFCAPKQGRPLHACSGEASALKHVTQRLCASSGACGIDVVGDCASACSAPNSVGGYGQCTATCWDETDMWPGQAHDMPYTEVITVHLAEPFPICGNSICDRGETPEMCAADCSTGWSLRPGGRGTSSATASAATVDADGHIFVAGARHPGMDLGDGPAPAGGTFLAKLAPSGQLLWSVSLGGAMPRATALAPNGDIVVGGTFYKPITLGGVEMVNASADVFVARLSGVDGAHIWSRHFGSTSLDGLDALAVDSTGAVILYGDHQAPIDFGGGPLKNSSVNVFLAKLSPSGAHVWSKTLGGGKVDWPGDMGVDAADRITITGSFEGSASFGAKSAFRSVGDSDGFLASYAPSGAHLWSKQFGSAGWDRYPRLGVNAAGEMVLAQTAFAPVTIGSVVVPAGSYDVLLARLDAGGNVVWAFALDGSNWYDEPVGVGFLADGGVVVGASLETSIDAGGGPMVSFGDVDPWVARFDADGVHVWSRRFGGYGYDRLGGLAFAGNDVIALGTYTSVSFEGPTPELTGAGSLYSFLVKFENPGAP